MGVFDPGIALHGFFPGSLAGGDVAAALDTAAERCGFTLIRVEAGKYPTRHYGDAGAPGLPFSYSLGSPWSQIAMFRAHRAEMEAYGPQRLGALFLNACEGLQTHLARTDPGNGDGLVQEGELGGDLQFVDWFQFFGPGLVARWGAAFLQQGPFAAVLPQPSGGVGIFLAIDPREEAWSRRRAAEFLGVSLTPLRAKLPSGDVRDVPWR